MRITLCRFVRLILFVSLLWSETAFSEQWYYSYVPRGRHVNSVKILDTAQIVIGGGNEFNDSLRDILLSPDKGLSWGASANSIDPWIKSMAFSDTKHGLAVGYTGTILKTNNGAISWTPVSTPINRQFMKVAYADPQTAFIVGGSVPRTDTLQTILKSVDSGITWSVLLDRPGYWLRGVTFTDSNHGIAVGDSGVILRTSNGGTNWSTITSPVIKTWNAVKFISESTGYIVGGVAWPDSASTILRTTDSGATWTILKNDFSGTLNDITFLNSSTGYICGDRAQLMKTINGGLNWSPVSIPSKLPTDVFNTVDFYNDNLGIVAGRYGQSYIYTNSVLPATFTFGSQFVDSTSFTLLGGVDTHGEGGVYTLYYSPDSTFINVFHNTYPDNVRSNYVKSIQAGISELTPDTTYYYFFQAQTLAGITNGDTLSLYTRQPVFTFQTITATNITSTSALLNGLIDKFPSSANISYEYGTTPSFGSEISADPGTVSDTFSHTISAQLSNLQPYTTYYYRLKGTHNTQSYFGSTLFFITGGAFKTFKTVDASAIYDSSATLNGTVDKFVVPVTLSFEYGTTNALGQEIPAIPPFINDTLLHDIKGTLSSLIPVTPYYFRLKGQTSLTTFFGDIMTFNSGVGYIFFNSMAATDITLNSARLHAEANHFAGPVSLSFEYGTTPAFGNTIAANPGFVSDTFFHSMSADLSGLQTDQVYYYRAKAFNGSTAAYTTTKQFYTGMPEIPNWDFQYWSRDTVNIPKDWNMVEEGFERVPGHSGNYAMKLFGQTLTLNGFVGDGGFFGGVPLNVSTRPDSITFFSKYDIEIGDTAYILLILKKQDHAISNKLYPIPGNSSGAFKRLSYKIDYDSLAVPDSAIMAFVTTNIVEGPPGPFYNNSLIIDDITFLPGNTSFAGSGFEDWFSSIVERPLSWFNIRYAGLVPDHPDSNHIASKVYFNAPDDFAAEIKNITWASLGMVIAGELNTKNGVIDDRSGGFPVRGRHVTFNGYIKYFLAAGDTLEISMGMKKGFADVGGAKSVLYDTLPDFTPFSFPILYNDTTTIPDTASIGFRIQSAHLHPGSRFTIDKLSFDGFISGVSNSKPDLLELDGMKVYPNPARDYLMIENLLSGNKECSLTLFGVNGQILKEVKLPAGQRTSQLDIGELSPGFYVLLLKKGDKMYSKIIIIQ